MNRSRRWLLWTSGAVGAVAAVWGLASLEQQPYAKFVDVRIDAPKDVCWEVDNGRVADDGTRESQFGCGDGGAGYDDDYVAVPAAVVVRKVQGEGTVRAWFVVDGDITESGRIEDVGGAVYLSGD